MCGSVELRPIGKQTQHARFSRVIWEQQPRQHRRRIPALRAGQSPTAYPPSTPDPPPRSCSRAQRAVRAFAGEWLRWRPQCSERLSALLRRSEWESDLVGVIRTEFVRKVREVAAVDHFPELARFS